MNFMDTSDERLALILGVTIPAVISTFFLNRVISFMVFYVLYRKCYILRNEPAQVLDTVNSDYGTPIGTKNVCTDATPGMMKVIELNEMDGIIEESSMDLGKEGTK
jgi:hypothetical protein